MKTVGLEHATLESCLREAQDDRVVITKEGKPIAFLVGVEGLDEDQLQYGVDEKFWAMIAERRLQKTLSRADLERKIDTKS